ncbi:hypothetical protein [Adlercreutzia equolifaciens]|uniref:hypothetical protein n=1 Tax=Adlercreutzia equolifaciens TaxID=446660 RepID=UPI00038975CF|nr:hypothetical protein [Adlercreutzia equolifaciens]RFT84783.1 hypothetical protein DX903_06280 [Adlercreutzia equolifaciens]BAN77255.1 hypothetical protein AEQU_1286 [Adlercreutzia equolifaciens DSM 19450]HJI11639.1 hypothetical protein [Adlercreutzia equolifaciens]
MSAIEKSDFEKFLVQGALPRAKNKLPEGLKASNLVWDAVWRAHRDVVLARQHVVPYSNYGNEPWVSPAKREPNVIAARLYEILVQWPEGEPLGSRSLIDQLLLGVERNGQKVVLDEGQLFGSVQKLVNMTLKYLVMLQLFGASDKYLERLPIISADECDCPLDSIVLEKLGGRFREMKWTRLSRQEYEEAQEEIEANQEVSGLRYDLENWSEWNADVRWAGDAK